MPRSRSRSLLSIARSATRSLARNVPLWCSSASTSVVLPWSTWAMMATLRRAGLATRLPGRTGVQASFQYTGNGAPASRPSYRLGRMSGRHAAAHGRWSPAPPPASARPSRRCSRARASTWCSRPGGPTGCEALAADLRRRFGCARARHRRRPRGPCGARAHRRRHRRRPASPVDALVNNAGYGAAGRLHRTRPGSDQRDLLQVMVVAVAELTHRLLPGMIARALRPHHQRGLAGGPGPESAGHTLYGASQVARHQVLAVPRPRGAAAQRARHRPVPGLHLQRVPRRQRHAAAGEPDAVASCAWTPATVARQGYDAVMRRPHRLRQRPRQPRHGAGSCATCRSGSMAARSSARRGTYRKV